MRKYNIHHCGRILLSGDFKIVPLNCSMCSTVHTSTYDLHVYKKRCREHCEKFSKQNNINYDKSAVRKGSTTNVSRASLLLEGPNIVKIHLKRALVSFLHNEDCKECIAWLYNTEKENENVGSSIQAAEVPEREETTDLAPYGNNIPSVEEMDTNEDCSEDDYEVEFIEDYDDAVLVTDNEHFETGDLMNINDLNIEEEYLIDLKIELLNNADAVPIENPILTTQFVECLNYFRENYIAEYEYDYFSFDETRKELNKRFDIDVKCVNPGHVTYFLRTLQKYPCLWHNLYKSEEPCNKALEALSTDINANIETIKTSIIHVFDWYILAWQRYSEDKLPSKYINYINACKYLQPHLCATYLNNQRIQKHHGHCHMTQAITRKLINKNLKRTKSNAIVKVYRCRLCYRTYSSKSSIRKHSKIHTQPKLYCQICAKKFVSAFIYKLHWKDHLKNARK